MKEIPVGVKNLTEQVKKLCAGKHVQWGEVFEKTFSDTITNALVEDENGIFVLTGDIPAMWQRDSTAQVRPYLIAAQKDKGTAFLIKKVLQRQFFNMNLDTYANAFNQTPNNKGHQTDKTKMSPWIWERKYEIDSLAYPINLAYLYWKNTDDTTIFDKSFISATHQAVETLRIEQHHTQSDYSFERFIDRPEDTLINNGRGADIAFTGMTWCGFRPSDDACVYNYSIPENMFAHKVLLQLSEIYQNVLKDKAFAIECQNLADEIWVGIQQYGIIKDQDGNDIYAFEVDGLGHHLFMDDANVPDLISLAYLGLVEQDDPIYQNTRKASLSKQNKYYYTGKYASGIGSPHTPVGYVWPIALAVEGMTTNSKKQKEELLNTLVNTTNGTQMMHEGFDPNDPSKFTRPWFSWANMMFCELVLDYFDLRIKQ
ncbi:glycoside hydrolase family 125 protein [uncultured Lactobacillus sp.]|uniref:glycoside hydrolase family 125 protein n=1 Tax=uncultured Lactobacillus sp. TaxID=153152 RepID=UPI0026047E86|nr:glycoside hydrolase family 125 protein [uncultured Lactobacillus sp.]